MLGVEIRDIELTSYEEVEDHLIKGSIITIIIDELKINIKRVSKIKPVITVQHYGNYPQDKLLYYLLSRYNIKLFVYFPNPPVTEFDEITKILLDSWINAEE